MSDVLNKNLISKLRYLTKALYVTRFLISNISITEVFYNSTTFKSVRGNMFLRNCFKKSLIVLVF